MIRIGYEVLWGKYRLAVYPTPGCCPSFSILLVFIPIRPLPYVPAYESDPIHPDSSCLTSALRMTHPKSFSRSVSRLDFCLTHDTSPPTHPAQSVHVYCSPLASLTQVRQPNCGCKVLGWPGCKTCHMGWHAMARVSTAQPGQGDRVLYDFV